MDNEKNIYIYFTMETDTGQWKTHIGQWKADFGQ